MGYNTWRNGEFAGCTEKSYPEEGTAKGRRTLLVILSENLQRINESVQGKELAMLQSRGHWNQITLYQPGNLAPFLYFLVS